MSCCARMNVLLLNVLLLVGVFSQIAYARPSEWFLVTGTASLNDTSYEAAKTRAMNDAYWQAAQISQQQNKRAFLGATIVEREYQESGKLKLDINVEIQFQPVCEQTQSQAYKKQVAVVGFSLLTPAQTSMGHVAEVERGFADLLGQALKSTDSLVVYEQSQIALHADVRNAPSHYTEQLTLSQATHFAKQAGVQFVVSGVILDMGLEDKGAYATDYWTRLKRMAGQTNQKRRFKVDVFIHDGFSGALVWQQQFDIQGQWQADLSERMAFDSPAFQYQDYGQQISRLTDSVAEEIAEQLRCQPFMTRITRVEGKTLHFSAGASAGIRPGDTLALYRTSNFYDANRLSGVDLQNVKTALTVSQVHPHFSSGTISIDPGRVNIQEDDLLIVW